MKTVCGSDEPHPYPVGSFFYRNAQVKADEVQLKILYYSLNRFEFILHLINLFIVI
jgi:hypothetical protein